MSRREPGRLRRLGVATALGRFAWSAQQRWRELPADRRSRLQTLVRQSGGRPSRLSPAQRKELSALLRDLRLGTLVRDAAVDATPPRGRFGRRG
jgi:hypothetical protein